MKNVHEVYNKIAQWFAENRNQGLMEKNHLDDLVERLPSNGTILDIGCGTGEPILKYLIDRNVALTGVDASFEMLEIAKKNFPSTEFIMQDMRSLQLGKKFDGIIAWHSLFHLPAADQPAMIDIFKKHLNVHGILLFTSGTQNGETWTENGGENLFMASLDTEEYRHLLKQHNFEVLKYVENDPDCGNANIWMAKLQ